MKELATIGFAKTDDEIENRGSRLHLLRGIESLQGTGASAQTLRDQDERRQSAGARTDNRNNTDKPSAKQGDNQQNNAHETSSAHRTYLHQRILGDTLTKSGKSGNHPKQSGFGTEQLPHRHRRWHIGLQRDSLQSNMI